MEKEKHENNVMMVIQQIEMDVLLLVKLNDEDEDEDEDLIHIVMI
jgi:hypothetical protein